MSKRILLVTQYFYPENFKSNDIAFELVKRGYQVDALVGIPNYPEGRYYKEYGLFKKRHEVVNGVHVYRAFQTPRGRGGWRLPINYFSYVISACFWILFKFAWRKYDCIIGHEPSPIFQAYPAILLRSIKKTPFYYWILDLWPPSIMNNPRNALTRWAFDNVNNQVRFIYKKCDKLLISSRLFKKHILDHCGKESQIEYFPNWSDDMMYGVQSELSVKIPDGFIVMMAGNLGDSQDLESVANLVMELRDINEIKWVFVGDGSKKQWLDSFIVDNKLENICYAVGRHPYSMMPSFYAKANAMLLSLKSASEQLDCVVPARLQSYMSSSKPVFAMIGKGGADVIKDANAGFCVAPSDYKGLADIIRSVVHDPSLLEQKGKSGRLYYEEHFTKDICIENLCRIINEGV